MVMINRVLNYMILMYMYKVVFIIKFILCKINTEYWVYGICEKIVFVNLN